MPALLINPPRRPLRYVGPCDCHLRSPRALGRHQHGDGGGRSGDSPVSDCPKCHGEGEIYTRDGAT
jgi:hypothetical protein